MHLSFILRCGLPGLLLLASACSDADTTTAVASRSADGSFHNRYDDSPPQGLEALLRWKWHAWRHRLPPAPHEPTPRQDADLEWLHANAVAGAHMQPALTWIGHATVLMQIGAANLLSDPQFSQRASPLSFIGPQRALPPGIALQDLPHIDAVLISHNHYDHLDEASVLALNRQPGGAPLFIVPLGVKAWMADIGIDHVVELDWWQSHTIGNVEIVLTPVQHWSGRGLGDRNHTLWGGYAVFAADAHLFFSGDTGYSKDFVDIRERFAARQDALHGGGFDAALLAIGAYEPRWFMKAHHVNPAEAVRIHRDLNAKRSLGIHWGTFELTDEALDEPPRALARAVREAALADDAFTVLPVGGTLRLPRRTGDGLRAASNTARPAPETSAVPRR